MPISVTIKNAEPLGSKGRLAVDVVTVGEMGAPDHKTVLQPQGELTVQVHEGQFLMVDETDKGE